MSFTFWGIKKEGDQIVWYRAVTIYDDMVEWVR